MVKYSHAKGRIKKGEVMMFKILKRIIPVLLITVLLLPILVSCNRIKNEKAEIIQDINDQSLISSNTANGDFNSFTDTLARKVIESSPLNASFVYGDLESQGLTPLLYELDDASEKEMMTQISESKEVLNQLNDFNRESLTKEQATIYDLIRYQNEGVVDGEPFMYYFSAFQPTSGVQTEVPMALMQIELESELEVQAYLSRLQEVPRLFDQFIDYENKRAEQGLMLPAYMYGLIINQIDEMEVDPEYFMMYLSFCDRIKSLNDLDEEKKSSYKAQCLEIVKNDLYPAYDKMKSFLTEVKDRSQNEKGISEWTNGQDYYNYLIKYATSYDMDAEDLRNWANKQLGEAMKELQTFLQEHQEVAQMQDLTSLLATVSSEKDLLKYEDEFLKAEFLDYPIKRAGENIIPSYLEEHLPPAFYFPISVDGEDYGNMYMTQQAFNNMDITTLETDIHENMPGHHLYFSVLYNSDVPLIEKVYEYNAYTEGWAQYVQGKTYEYTSLDPHMAAFWSNLMKMNYAYQVLLDIQVNYDGITKDDAMEILNGMNYDAETSEDIYNRMIANPGEMVDYYFGDYKIESYREECEEALGNDFDVRDFHDLILRHGNMPFSVMDGIVEDYIGGQGK